MTARLHIEPVADADAHVDDWSLLLEVDPAIGIERLFDRHRDYVYRLARGVLGGDASLADDVTQEVFLRLSRRRPHWRPRARFTTWLYRVTLNVARELGRRAARERPAADRVEPAPELQGSGTAQDAALLDVYRALARLPERQRTAVVLRHLEGFDTRETARVMGCREGSVKTHLHRALARLRELLGDDESASTAAPAARR